MSDPVKILKTEILSNQKYVLKKMEFEYSQSDGTKQTQTREVYERGNGATILLYNTESKTVILTRQFRLPTYINGNENGKLIEACAGIMEKESAEDCIKRETEEETGYKVPEVKKIFEAYMSPGSVTEIIHFFIGEYSQAMKVSSGGGLQEEHEYIEVLEISFDKAMKMVGSGEIKDAKTIMLLQYVELNQVL